MRGFWPTFILGIGTYLTRASFILIFAHRIVPPRLERALRNVGPAVLAALVASLMVGTDGVAGLRLTAEMVSLFVAILVAWRTRNMSITLAAGMVAVWTLGAVW
jgi:branched-subunit amino acid transport protein